jgi:euchromatic histone-lysine N-methyltransferase
LYQATYRKLEQVKEQGITIVGQIYLETAKAIKKDPVYTKLGAIMGNVPGVEVGDEFHFRIELSIVGLHRQYQGGIDTSKVNGVPVAISVLPPEAILMNCQAQVN